MTVDLAIVGGGFAGLAAARAAALRGLTTVVLEAKPQLGVRLHTTGIFVREAADAYDVPVALCRRVPNVRLYGPSRRSVALDSPGYYFLTTDTAAVLRWLGEEAERVGAAIHTGRRVTGAAREGGVWRLSAGGEPLAARYLIAADGARSPTAAMLGLSANRRFLAGVEREYAGTGRLEPDSLHVFLDSRIAPGYIAWAAASPIGCQVGLAVSDGHKPQIEPFAREAEAMFGLSGEDEPGRRAGLIPCGGLLPRWHGPGTMLVGDSAGMVSPLTAGGIHPALALGRRAGQAVADHLLAGGAEPWRAVARDVPGWGVKQLLRNLLDLAPPNWLFDAALASAPMLAFSRRVFFGRPSRGAAPQMNAG